MTAMNNNSKKSQMTRIINYFLGTLLLLVAGTACNEDALIEEPLDFLDPASAYRTYDDFQSGLVDLYAKVRTVRYGDANHSYAHYFGTDIFDNARDDGSTVRFGDYVTTLNPTGLLTIFHWSSWYKVVSNSNAILSRLSTADLTDEEITEIEAETKFFRALAYRYLVYLYGDVPLYTEEISSPKTDFERAPKQEVLQQVISDASFAAANLPDISDAVDGRVSNLVAYHLLAETYISLEDYDKAIEAATVVIDDPNTALMTTRFGSMASLEPGDVYWDLFRLNNQNRSSGNTEALWVMQTEVNVPGGFLTTNGIDGTILERIHSPVSWTLNDPDGVIGILGPRSDINVAGRGVSFLKPTPFFENTLWESDFDNDIRNASHNYVRTIIYDNPASAYFGQSAVENPGSVILSSDWRWYPHLTKVTTPGQHPDNLYLDPALLLLNNSAGATYTDQYYLRLAETYLLRAEAYLKKGLLSSAADDINAVRTRANATPIVDAEVTLDYILDERARELSLEEERRITLHRTGTLVERVQLYNELNGDEITDANNLWPIPATEIEANINGSLTQNPGY